MSSPTECFAHSALRAQNETPLADRMNVIIGANADGTIFLEEVVRRLSAANRRATWK